MTHRTVKKCFACTNVYRGDDGIERCAALPHISIKSFNVTECGRYVQRDSPVSFFTSAKEARLRELSEQLKNAKDDKDKELTMEIIVAEFGFYEA